MTFQTNIVMAASRERVKTEWQAQNFPRYRLKAGDLYLHLSGEKLTDIKAHAFIDCEKRARRMLKGNPLAAGCKMVQA